MTDAILLLFKTLDAKVEQLEQRFERKIIKLHKLYGGCQSIGGAERHRLRLEVLERKYKHIDECFAENTVDIRALEEEVEGKRQ